MFGGREEKCCISTCRLIACRQLFDTPRPRAKVALALALFVTWSLKSGLGLSRPSINSINFLKNKRNHSTQPKSNYCELLLSYPIIMSSEKVQSMTESSLTIPSDSEQYSANDELSPSPPSSSSSPPMILYTPPTFWGLFRGAAINLFLPFINGLMLGFGELFAHEAAFRLGWGGTKVFTALFFKRWWWTFGCLSVSLLSCFLGGPIALAGYKQSLPWLYTC